MLIDRVLSPKDGGLFFHYCSAGTLQAICDNKTIRFSDINMFNNSQEMHWAYSVFEEAATQLLHQSVSALSGISVEFFNQVDSIISPMPFNVHPIVACFSREPDLLSQWRAYGDDGKGFSVGFDAGALAAMPVTLLEVLYDREKQVAEMKEALGAIFLQNKASGEAFGPDVRTSCALLASSWLRSSILRSPRKRRCGAFIF